MGRLDTDRQDRLEPKRTKYAKDAIDKLGHNVVYWDKSRIDFIFKGETVTLYPYSGWHSGKSIIDGRGIKLLLKQIDTEL